METTWTVSELTIHIKQVLENNELLKNIIVKGEISNASIAPSGHLYFTLKDSESQISCVMFSARSRLPVFLKDIKDGIKVIAYGRITLYEKRGQYQLQVETLTPDGIGELYKAFQRLKEKLQNEGLFDETLKLPIPLCPNTVGIVTSPTGAAIHDMVTIMRRRNPATNIILSPAIVQGEEAPSSIIRALTFLWKIKGIDVIIIGRGGGSLEDLWAFNDEQLARTIRQSPIPIVSAVGHETDFTISDLVADKRAPTPSGAAELVVPDRDNLNRHIAALQYKITGLLERKVSKERSRLELLMERRPFKFPFDKIRTISQRLDDLVRTLRHGLIHNVMVNKERLSALSSKLEALSPMAILERGYCLAATLPERQLVKSAATPKGGQYLSLRFKDGEICCQVTKQNRSIKNTPVKIKDLSKNAPSKTKQLLLSIDA